MLFEGCRSRGKYDMLGLLLARGNRSAAVFADVVSSRETTLPKIIRKDSEQHVSYMAILNYTDISRGIVFN
jgi:hypothetical protein